METPSCSVRELQSMKAEDLKLLRDVMIVEDAGEMLVAVLPYQYYLKIQTLMIKLDEYLDELGIPI